MIDAYRALALQLATRAVTSREQIAEAIGRMAAQVAGARAWLGPELRLVVLPEYFLTGFPMGHDVPAWQKLACLAPDGPEYEAMGEVARRHGLFLSGNAYETDPHFPGLYFQASFIIDPSGEVVLRYRRLHSMFSPTPYDVWDAYLEVYGVEAVFPVARTELGALACVASEEILYPELVRALALRGAEVLCHSTSEVSAPTLTPKAVARRARALENLAYVVSANSGGLDGIPISRDSTNGGSEVVDFEARQLAVAGPGESLVASAELDLAALRRTRARPAMTNLPARLKPALWAQEYGRHEVEPPNALLDGQVPDRAWFVRRQQEIIASRTPGTPSSHREP
ncbi:nitrilase-related carbon-nitrogen hydrolase [Nonomuraea sp. NPDC050663]|uniref:nitrilase-related carbon-nitrogen hydrolase n=1 Tax=Nonomuraea sp. NPDC050663 TaxID=3364370 RepID=UPI0037B93FAF